MMQLMLSATKLKPIGISQVFVLDGKVYKSDLLALPAS